VTLRGAPPREARALPAAAALAAILGAATVLAQICYPLTTGEPRRILTIVTVLLFAAASTAACAATRGARAGLTLLGVAAGAGFAAEALGVATGFPFGGYRYSGTLGAQLAGVPLVIPLAWAMMAWPALAVGRLLGSPALLGGLALASWDLFLDPQMVQAGHWEWTGGGPRLNGIPLTNTLGWLVVGVALVATLDRVLPRSPRPGTDDRLAVGLWLWTYASSVLANLAFFGRPGVALAGGLGMGLVAVPLVRRLLPAP